MSPTSSKALGAALRTHREQAGLSLREVSRRVGVPASTVQRFERGEIEAPDPYKLARFADALGIEVEELYALAGLTPASGLPTFGTYLRAKTGLSDAAIGEAEAFLAELRAREEAGDAEPDR
jgi:transcriptional regulator with XRE-family HTH domain